ncbi:MAG TPA: anti-sigma factor [Anaerolineae bacterium]|nr:anti-sigma factor [Anaerolineae bacterium]
MDQQTCQHLLGGLSEYLDGEASADLCAEVERHLAECADCRVLVDTLRKTVSLYRELPQPEMPTAARERLYTSLDLAEFLAPKP